MFIQYLEIHCTFIAHCKLHIQYDIVTVFRYLEIAVSNNRFLGLFDPGLVSQPVVFNEDFGQCNCLI